MSACLGYVLPTLYRIKYGLEKQNNLTYCTPLKIVLLDSINRRFGNIMDLNDPKSKPFFNATISHPKFKLKWLTNTEHRELAKKIFLEECRKNKIINVSGEADMLRFFDEKSDIKNFPTILEIYLKYNTVLSSSAPVERLFSSGGKILTASRNKLSDENFETLLFLKKNKDYA